MKKIFLIFIFLFLSACSAPQKVANEVSKFLRGDCLALFLDSGIYRYQHLSQAPAGRAVFALSDGASGQFCGYATNNYKDVKESTFEILAPWDKLEVVAIARCEKVKPVGANPCKIFARNNKIVWTLNLKSTLD